MTYGTQPVYPSPSSGAGQVIRWMLAATGVLVACLLGLLILLIMGLNTGPVGLLIGMILAMLPVPVYVVLALWLDRYEAEPVWMLAFAFFWGAIGAVFVALIINTLSGAVVGAVAGGRAGALFSAVISAPFVEESAKALVLFILFFWKRDEFDGIIDGIVYASMVGLGFAMTENILYYGRALNEGLAGSLFSFVLRGVMSPFSHPLFTSMTGIGLGWARQSDRPAVRALAPLAGLCMAMFLHFLWNFTASLGALFLVSYVLIMVPVFMGVLILVFFSLRREGEVVRAQLQAEVYSGVLTPEELAELGTVSGRWSASWRALQRGGPPAWRARGELNQTASELAFHRRRVAAGITDPHEDAARDAAYVARLQELIPRLRS